MLVLDLFDLDHRLIFELSELFLPVSVELMEFLVTDFDVLSELRVLNIDSELVLKYVDVLLQKSNLPHQIFVGLVLLDVAKLFSQNLHLFLQHTHN